jgi:uncharacterized protein
VTTGPWLVPVTTLRRHPGSRREERRAGPVGELKVASSMIPAGAEARADALLDAVGGGIEVSASVQAPWEGECRRCLRPLRGELHCEVRELYRERDPHEPGGTEADEETYPLNGDQLDLRPLVRDALLLELPLAPLCRPDCRGLCPTCGADLNEESCDCAPPADPRWAALDALHPPALHPPALHPPAEPHGSG